MDKYQSLRVVVCIVTYAAIRNKRFLIWWLKMQKKAEKYVLFYRRMEVVGRNKNNPFPFPVVQWIVSLLERKSNQKKKKIKLALSFTLQTPFRYRLAWRVYRLHKYRLAWKLWHQAKSRNRSPSQFQECFITG